MIDWPEDVTVIFCITTFKRDYQIELALPLNVRHTLPYKNIFHAVVDFNEREKPLPAFLEGVMRLVMQRGHVCYGRARFPDGYFHCPSPRTRPTYLPWRSLR